MERKANTLDTHIDFCGFSQRSSLLYFFLPTCGVTKEIIIWIISGLSIMKALGTYMILLAGQLKVLL